LQALDLIRHALHRRGDVGEQALLLLGAELRNKLPACV